MSTTSDDEPLAANPAVFAAWFMNTHAITSAGTLSLLQSIPGEFVLQFYFSTVSRTSFDTRRTSNLEGALSFEWFQKIGGYASTPTSINLTADRSPKPLRQVSTRFVASGTRHSYASVTRLYSLAVL